MRINWYQDGEHDYYAIFDDDGEFNSTGDVPHDVTDTEAWLRASYPNAIIKEVPNDP